jgi:hypothetical protein
MARRSLKPQLNQIRAWVRQGRTDAWIAHQLEVSASELREFRSQHDLTADDEDTGSGEIDLRDEIEAEIEAAAAEEEEEEEAEEEPFDEEEPDSDDEGEAADEGPARRERNEGGGARREGGGRERGEGGGDGGPRRRRRRGRRGGRGRRRPEYEATFDHGERDGYGLWFDPSVRDNPVYAQHWAGKSEVTVRIDPDQIVIRRPGAPAPEGESPDSDE